MSQNGNSFASRLWASLLHKTRPREGDLAAYRRLALQLHYDLPQPGATRAALLVTPRESMAGARGSVALACCLADEIGRPVLLVDACPSSPQVSRLLEASTHRGFTEYLADPGSSLDDLTLDTSHDGVSFLPAGAGDAAVPAGPEAILRMIEAARQDYDFVLVAGGSVLNDSTSMAIAPHVGSVLLLVEENQTLVEDLDAAQGALRFCKASKVGLVLTTAAKAEPASH